MLGYFLLLAGVAGQSSQQQQTAAAAIAKALELQRASVELQRSATQKQKTDATRVSPGSADCPPLSPSKAEEIIASAAKDTSVEPALIRAVMRQESGFRPCAVSGKGAQGLMQLMPQTATTLGVRDAFQPEQNAAGGARYLRTLLDLYEGDLRLALAAYNAGPGKVSRSGGVPAIPETAAYVNAIMRNLSSLPVTR